MTSLTSINRHRTAPFFLQTKRRSWFGKLLTVRRAITIETEERKVLRKKGTKVRAGAKTENLKDRTQEVATEEGQAQ